MSIRVVFPEPVCPTKAMELDFGMVKVMSLIAGLSDLGYR